MHVAVKELRIATMTNDAVPIGGLLIKTERHSIHSIVGTKRTRVHLDGGLGLQDLCIAKLAILRPPATDKFHGF